MESLWEKTAEIKRFPQLEENIKTDVLIIGGGMAGILCAYMLHNAGIDYILIDSDRICRGITANTTAKITSQHGLIFDKLLKRFGKDKTALYIEANEKAIERYRNLCQSIDCNFENKTNYIYSIDNEAKLEKEMQALERVGYNAIFRKDPNIPITNCGAVGFENQAQFQPLKFVSGIIECLNIYENTAAREYKGKCITTDKGTIKAEKIIVATHFPIFNKHGNYFIKMYQHRSYVVALKNANKVDGMYMDENDKGLSFRNYDDYLILGGGGHRTGKHGGSWNELKKFYNIHYPASEEVCRWATQDCITLDDVPYIGKYSAQTPDLYVATGFNKWGMTSSMVAAEILCDLVRDKENKYAEVFDPSRSIIRAKLISNSLEAAASLITPTTPRCPHMGCALKWNKYERTWDCSCHGSRFTPSGIVIENPATDNIVTKKKVR